jgi:protein-tyrosine phosphatase
VSTLRGRQVTAEDFAEFDLILAMDKSNLSNLQAIQPAASKAELALYLPRFGISPDEVPDPYYGGEDGFELVLDMLEHASQVLLDEIKAKM